MEAGARPSSIQRALRLLGLGAPLVVAAASLDGAFALFLIAVQAFFPDTLHAGAAGPGYALAIYGSTRVLLQGPGGLLARRLGTGRQIALGMAGGVLSLAALVVAASPWQAYLLTLAYGVMTALAWPAIFLRAGDLVEKRRGELIGYTTLCATAASISGMASGAFLVDFVPVRLVITAGAALLAAGTVVGAVLLARQGAVPPRTSENILANAHMRPGMLPVCAALLTQGLGLAMLTPILRQYAQEQLGLQLHNLIVLAIPAAVCAALTFLLAGRLTDHVGRAPVVAGGAVVAGAGTFLIAAAHGGLVFALGVAPFAVGYAASAPALGAWITDLTDGGGGSVGLALTVQGLALAVGPALTGLIVRYGTTPTAMRLAAFFWLVAAICALWPQARTATRDRRQSEPGPEGGAGRRARRRVIAKDVRDQ